MLSLPFQVLGVWLRGLFALALLGLGIGFIYAWYDRLPRAVEVVRPAEATPPDGEPRVAQPELVVVRHQPWRPGWDRETALLLAGVALTVWSLGGGLPFRGLPRNRKADVPPPEVSGTPIRVTGQGGAELHAEVSGPPDGPPVVFIHGWGLDAGEWCYARDHLARRYRVFVWDLPGLGRSESPADKDWSLEKLAADLDAVLSLNGNRPAVVVGHSIGGMIALTYCKLYAGTLGRRMAGLALAHTTYTNPVRTTKHAPLYAALQKPLLEPLCHLMVGLAPLLWVMNWLSYLNGSIQRSTERGSFSGRESRAQLNALSWKYVRAWPGVIGRGMLAMFRYDATAALPAISVPTLVTVGDRDECCLPGAGEFIARSVPGAKLFRLPEARHCGLYEFHNDFDRALEEFIDSCTRKSAGPSGTGAAAQTVQSGHAGSA